MLTINETKKQRTLKALSHTSIIRRVISLLPLLSRCLVSVRIVEFGIAIIVQLKHTHSLQRRKRWY